MCVCERKTGGDLGEEQREQRDENKQTWNKWDEMLTLLTNLIQGYKQFLYYFFPFPLVILKLFQFYLRKSLMFPRGGEK